jgi:peroxiredoxin Q/BCP
MDFSLLGFSGLRYLYNVHPAFVHFPVALIPVAFFFYGLGIWRHSDAFRTIGRACLYAGALGAIGAAATGWLAEDSFPHGAIVHHMMTTHETIGVAILIVTGLLVAWSFWQKDHAPRGKWLFLLLFAFDVLLVLQTADLGARMVYLQGAAVRPVVVSGNLSGGGALDPAGGKAMAGELKGAALKVGDPAPDFTAASSDGTQVHLKSLIGRSPIVLYFYPKDDTPGCTKEACGIRDSFAALRKLNATVFGISYDSIESHKRFIEKYRLPFALLSDTDKNIAKLYNAKGLIMAKRMTYVIDKAGKIVWINPSVNPSTHSDELQAVLSRLES